MLYGNHITLQPLSESDLDLMDWMNQDTETMRFLGALVRLEAELRDLFKNSKLISSNRGWGWMTIETPQQQKIGFVFLQPSSRLSEIELGYRIHRSYWGQGYATESARVLLSHAVNELSFNPIVA
ncbi:MAG: GNAT family N-acetyltransferase, partial [Cyanobacteria bacterium J06626_26]